MEAHINTKKHKEAGAAILSTKSVASFFGPEVESSTIRAESIWSLFIAKHNLAFLSSNHANKLFKVMFPDAQKFCMWSYKDNSHCE